MKHVPSFLLAACIAVASVSAAHAQPAVPATPPTSPPTQAPPTEPPTTQPTLGDDKQAIDAAEKWLDLLDADKAGVAWDSASKELQKVVKRDQFVTEMRGVRKELGKLDSRKAVKFARAHELPGGAPGDYALIEFDSKYKNGKHLAEQLIWSVEAGDTWRVVGYFYR